MKVELSPTGQYRVRKQGRFGLWFNHWDRDVSFNRAYASIDHQVRTWERAYPDNLKFKVAPMPRWSFDAKMKAFWACTWIILGIAQFGLFISNTAQLENGDAYGMHPLWNLGLGLFYLYGVILIWSRQRLKA